CAREGGVYSYGSNRFDVW
nr:immunoglobulin heavy chain junction region [Macaca mulatta]MOX37729.1 immunoglobulin heavy chain junction region [Macaca mulatta]MOX37749.1 immunoglobulin heavy chain junction region [Macaca mulatta]MOX37849.1 immunoglobulin heavy chain junction region [Macaca mulatta]MOX38097.1 immunoglobulin heavy chain junction region [Macaca mulatta]